MAIAQVTLTGTFVDFAGRAMTGQITFTPTPSAVNDAGADLVYMPRPIVVPLEPGGRLSVDLAATDDTDGNPVGFTYTVTEQFDNFAGGRSYAISLPAAASPVDLADISPESSANAGTVVWAGMPVGGTVGQFMVKTGAPNYEAGWSTMADQYLQGTGFPEGVVTAVVGSVYTDTAATGGVIRWTKFTGSGNTGWLADPIDSAVVHKTGTETIAGAKTFTSSPTFTSGGATVSSASGNPYFVSNASDTSAERVAGVLFQRRGSNRWVVAKIQNAESGSNAGSDFHILRYDDSGSQIGTASLSIIRSTGENRIGETTAGTAHLRLDRSAGNVGIITGTGFPEGVVTAPVGSMYTDTAATNGAIRWIKATGSGNTGWRVDFGDTGWRVVAAWNSSAVFSSGSLPAGWSPRSGLAGSLRVRRIHDHVQFYASHLKVAVANTSDAIWTVPAGFQASSGPVPSTTVTFVDANTAATFPAGIRGTARGQSMSLPLDSFVPDLSVDWPTIDAWPATLPGTA